MGLVKVLVDFVACEANGVCIEESPEVFGWTDDDELDLLDDSPPEEVWDATRRAAQMCPKRAIVLR